MFGFIEGYSDNDTIYYCPACGAKIGTRFADGTAMCDDCGVRFGVIEIELGNETEGQYEEI